MEVRCQTQRSAPATEPLVGLCLLLAGEAVPDGWSTLSSDVIQLLVEGQHRELVLAYRHGSAASNVPRGTSDRAVNGLALYPEQTRPEKVWKPAHSWSFSSAAKGKSLERKRLYLRQGTPHPPIRQLAIISGLWEDLTPSDWGEIHSLWKLLPFNFANNLAEFAHVGFSTRSGPS